MRVSSSLLLSLVSLASSANGATTSTSLAELLPGETALYISANVGDFVSGLGELDIVRLIQNEEMQDFLAPVFQQIPFLNPKDPIASLWGMCPAKEYLAGQVAIGISGLSAQYTRPDGSVGYHRLSPNHPISARLVHDLISYQETRWVNGEKTTVGEAPIDRFSLDFLATIDPGPQLRGMADATIGSPPPFVEVGELQMDGKKIHAFLITIPDSGGITTTIYADLSGDRWLIGGDETTFRTALAGKRPDSLAASTNYRAIHAGTVSGTEALFAFIDTATALKSLRPLVAPILMEELDILGVNAFRGVGLGMSMVSGGMRESFMIGYDGDQPGILSALRALGGGFPSLRNAPATTTAFVGLRFDPNALKDHLLAVVERVAPRMVPFVSRELANIEVEGWKLFDDILPAFGSEIALSVSAPKHGPIPEAVLSVEVRDRQKFEHLLGFARGMLMQEGVEISDLNLKGDAPGFVVKIPDAPQPAFVLRDDRLIGASSAVSLRTHLARHIDAPDAKTLAQSSDVLPRILQGLVGERGDSLALLVYLDLFSSLPAVYETALPFLQPALDSAGVPLDTSLLPLTETLQEYLSGMAIGLTSDENGLGIHAFTPTGLLPLAAVATAVETHHAVKPSRRGDSD